MGLLKMLPQSKHNIGKRIMTTPLDHISNVVDYYDDCFGGGLGIPIALMSNTNGYNKRRDSHWLPAAEDQQDEFSSGFLSLR